MDDDLHELLAALVAENAAWAEQLQTLAARDAELLDALVADNLTWAEGLNVGPGDVG